MKQVAAWAVIGTLVGAGIGTFFSPSINQMTINHCIPIFAGLITVIGLIKFVFWLLPNRDDQNESISNG